MLSCGLIIDIIVVAGVRPMNDAHSILGAEIKTSMEEISMFFKKNINPV